MLHAHGTTRHAITAALILTALAVPSGSSSQETSQPDGRRSASPIQIPLSTLSEHERIRAALARATEAPGPIGAAARELAVVLHPHLLREEQIALAPLGLLVPLARGEFTPEMQAVLPMTDSLRAELPRMLEEHEALRAASLRLAEIAQAEGDSGVARFAEQLLRHAKSEEEVLYPAAALVGDIVRVRMVLRRRSMQSRRGE